MSTLRRRIISRRSGKAGIGTILLVLVIFVTVVITAGSTILAMTLKSQNLGNVFSSSIGSNPLASPNDLLPISAVNGTALENQNTSNCNQGNWSSIYAEYESSLNAQQNSKLGQQYLNDPQFIAFLSQYLNMTDPYVNATVTQLLTGNESSLIQQQLQSQSLQC